MTTPWSVNDISAELSRAFSPEQPSHKDDTSIPKVSIDVLITFDKEGISSHANHKSLYYGALAWKRRLLDAGATAAVYSLTTTNIFRKYLSLLDIPFTLLLEFVSPKVQDSGGLPERIVYISDVKRYRTAQRAMMEAHKSQMLWFRYGWLALSRYVSTNDLVRRYAE
jgi:N-acetylglucosaminylphosphatidylinositol deacetylase